MICKHRADLFLKADREFHNNLLWIAATGSYRETKYFREAILYLIFNICELNPTNKVGNVVHEFLKTFFFKKAEYRTVVYKEIRYQILPILWKNYRAIDRKKAKKINVFSKRTRRSRTSR